MRFSSFSASGEPPTREQIEQWRRRTSPPDNEFPAAAGLSVLLARTDDAAVGITHLEGFSTGFRFTLAVRVRQVRPEFARGGLFMFVDSHPPHPGIEISLEDRLLLGIEYSDGQRASTLHGRQMPDLSAEIDDRQLRLSPQGGSGGEQSVDKTYWVSPLPPEGPVTFVLTWPAFGMAETRTVLDSAAILAAAGRSQLLWPPQPHLEFVEPPAPPRPSSGWFAEPA